MNQENNALVEFYVTAVQNNFKTAEEQRPVYDDVVFIRIQTPGDTRTRIERKATDQDKRRFPKSWAAFETQTELVEGGTPLSEWTGISASQVRELAHVHVRTVEQLASLSDSSIQRMGPGYQQLQKSARNWIETSNDNAASTEAMRLNDALKEENEHLKETITYLEEKVKQLESAAKADKKTKAA